MKITSYNFGDIISYRNEEYVFLASTEDSIFLAKILSHEDSETVKSLDKKMTDNGLPHAMNKLSVCFIVLSTAEFKNRAVFYGRTQYPFDMLTNKLSTYINDADLKALKQEILQSRATSTILKEEMEKILFE
jgi:hypothetical protein